MNTRFVAIAQVDVSTVSSQPVIATVAEPLDGGSSILLGWSSSLPSMPTVQRTLPWSTSMRVEALASNGIGTTVIAGRNGSSTSYEIVAPATSFGTLGSGVFETGMGPGRVSRLTVVNAQMAPVFAFVEGGTQPEVARLYRVGSGSISPLSVRSAADAGLAYGDDIINSPFPLMGIFDTRMMMVTRCTGTCSFSGQSSTASGLAARFGWFTIDPLLTAAGAPQNHQPLFEMMTTQVFLGDARLRAMSDGLNFTYFAGQAPTNQLLVERRSAAPSSGGNLRDAVYPTEGNIRLVDIMRAANGSGVLLLAVYSGSVGVAFNRVNLPFTSGDQGNVLLVYFDSVMSPEVMPFDRPGNQQPVGFARAGTELVIAINEGPNAVLWRVPGR